MDDKRIDLMKNAPISKAINGLAIPATIGLMVMAVYNIVDTMFVAWLGTEATGATQIVMPIMLLLSACGMAFGIGGGSYVSRLLGMDKKKRADEVGTVAIFSTVALAAVITVLSMVFMEPFLSFFGATESSMALAKSYASYILMATIFTTTNVTLNSLLRAEGSAKLSMIGMGVGAGLNIILDPLLIFTFDMGISGAAIATAFSQFVTFVILFSRYLNGHSVLHIRFRNFKPTKTIYGEIFKIGMASFIRQMLMSIALGVLNQVAVVYGGDALLAAVGLIFRVTMIPMYIIYGFSQGFQPVAGYNFGAGDHGRVMEAVRYTMLVSVAVAFVSGILLVVFDTQILSIFKAAEDVVAYAAQGFRVYFWVMILMGVTITISSFYQALGKGKESFILSLTRQGIYFIPIVLLLPKHMGATGVIAAQLGADVLTFITVLIMFIPYLKSGKIKTDILVNQDS